MKGSNPSLMPENQKQKEGIESGRDAKEPETKRREQIQEGCLRTRNKTNGSNPGAMPENPKQNEGIVSGRDVKELEIKGGDQIQK